MFYNGLLTIFFLVISNLFMILAWYGHLKFNEMKAFQDMRLWQIILISWGIALLEYIFQVPANKFGFQQNGGSFNLWQLKMLQEFINLTLFTIFVLWVFKTETFTWNHAFGFFFLLVAVYFLFKK